MSTPTKGGIKTKYLDVRTHVRELIRTLGSGERLPSEAELCARFKVSRVTVRRALDQIEREGLILRKKGHGTFVNKSNVRTGQKSFLLVSQFSEARITHISQILAGCLSSAAASNALLHFASERKTPADVVSLAKQLKVHGVIGVAPYQHQMDVLEELRISGCPVLIINRALTNSHLSYVSTDHRQGARAATDHLIAQGHKRIAFVADMPWLSFADQRRQGYEEACNNHGIAPQEELMVRLNERAPAREIEEAILAQLKTILTQHKPTALLLASGLPKLWAPALHLMRKLKVSIPNDIEVAAFDGVAEGAPEKEHIHEIIQSLFKLGSTAVELLGEIADGNGQRIRKLLPPDLCLKNTV
jgi:GntR family transcriptional regulator, arabinose operon transcriptional repressor